LNSAQAVSKMAEMPPADSALLDPSVEGIRIQFSFNNRDAISAWIWGMEADTLAQRRDRKEKEVTQPGIQFIPATSNVGLSAFLLELLDAGYVMTDAVTQSRPHPTQKGQWYLMVRFVFHKTPLVTAPSPEFTTLIQRHYQPALERLVREAMWRIRGYRNPLPREGASSTFGMSINCEVRTPFRNSMGQPVVQWQKDTAGKRVGEKALPIEPTQYLRITDNRIVLE
jgi:hypothetical protein